MDLEERLIRAINPWMMRILDSRFHWLASRDIMTIEFAGRKSGRRYSTPISYVQDGGVIYGVTESDWWKNLRGGKPVTLKLRGLTVPATADVITDDPEKVHERLRYFFTRIPRDARFAQVGLDENRRPIEADLERAAEKVVILVLSLGATDS